MEVLTVISDDEIIKSLLLKCLDRNSRVKRTNKDIDTIFYQEFDNRKNKLWLHFNFLDFENELTYNYNKEDISSIRNVFTTEQKIWAIDISYNSELLISQIIHDFKNLILNENIPIKILISHPFKGIIHFLPYT